MKQGTDEWHDFRRCGIGSSDAPVVMGVSPFKTPYQLYMEKLGLAESKVSTWATERGTRLEPNARARYELLTGIDFEPRCFVHPEVPELRASLDGWNEEKRIVLEIKVPCERVFNLARQGIVAEEYEPQLLHQQIVTGASVVHFYCVKVEGKGTSERITDGATVLYKGTDEKRHALLLEEIKFWQCVENRVPPPLTDRDYFEVSDETNLGLMATLFRAKTDYERLRDEIEKLRSTIDDFTAQITGAVAHPRIRGPGVELQRINAKQPFWKVRLL